MAEAVIIGGGISGIAAAIELKSLCPSLDVTVLEKNDRILKKLAVSGNGQGNLSNENICRSRYHGKNIHYFENVTENFNFASFAEKLTLDTAILQKGRIYPASLKAASVCDLLRFTAEMLKVTITTSASVEKIEYNDKYTVIYKYGENITSMSADYIICATGGASGKNLGTDGSAYQLYKNLGHTVTALYPSLVQLKTELDAIRVLKGVKFNCSVKLYSDNTLIKQSEGEILFTEYGISGPAVFDISGDAAAASEKSKTYVIIDFLPEYEERRILDFLNRRKKILPLLPLENAFITLISTQCVRAAINLCKMKFYTPLGTVREQDLTEITKTLKNFRLAVTGTTGFNNSQVTKGGISNNEVNRNLESAILPNLYFCGEVLDIDGDCGGFNIHFALASGICAAKAIAEKVLKARKI